MIRCVPAHSRWIDSGCLASIYQNCTVDTAYGNSRINERHFQEAVFHVTRNRYFSLLLRSGCQKGKGKKDEKGPFLPVSTDPERMRRQMNAAIAPSSGKERRLGHCKSVFHIYFVFRAFIIGPLHHTDIRTRDYSTGQAAAMC